MSDEEEIAPTGAEQKDFKMVLMTIYSVENAGIRYISAALQREGISTDIIFLRDWVHNRLAMPSDDEVDMALDIMESKRPDIIGLGFMSSLYPIASEVTRRIKERFPDIPIIWGGIHPTSAPEECILEVDYLCVGEGELAIIDLCNALIEGEDDTSIPNIWARKEDTIHRNKARPLIQDLDWLQQLFS